MPPYRRNLSNNVIGFTNERLVRMVRDCEWGNISLGVVIANDSYMYEFARRMIESYIRGNPNWDYCEMTIAVTYDRYTRYRNDIHDGEIVVCSSLYWRDNDSLRERSNIALYNDDGTCYATDGLNIRTMSIDEAEYRDWTHATTSYTPYLTGSFVNTYSTGTDYTATNRTWSDLGYANITTSPPRFEYRRSREYCDLREKLFGERSEKEEDLQESPELDKYLEEFLVIKP